MKFKNLFLTINLAFFGNIYCLSDDTDGYSTPPRKLRRTDIDYTEILDQYVEFKNIFRQVEDFDYGFAGMYLDKINGIHDDSRLRFVNPALKKEIGDFIGSDEVSQFYVKYSLYRTNLKKELNRLLVLGGGSENKYFLPRELTDIINEYVCK